jgi:hypothetical protein
LPGAIASVLTPTIAGAVALVQAADVPGSLAITAAAIALAAATRWFRPNRD